MQKRQWLSPFLTLIILLLTFKVAPAAFALDCEVISPEAAAGYATTIVQARVTDRFHEDGALFVMGAASEGPVFLQVVVKKVWRGDVTAGEVIRFSDPEWGGLPALGSEKIFYLNKHNGHYVTGNCIRLVDASHEEIRELDALFGPAGAPDAGESVALVTWQAPPIAPLQPIAIGPGGSQGTDPLASASKLSFNLLCLVGFLAACLGSWWLGRRHDDPGNAKDPAMK